MQLFGQNNYPFLINEKITYFINKYQLIFGYLIKPKQFATYFIKQKRRPSQTNVFQLIMVNLLVQMHLLLTDIISACQDGAALYSAVHYNAVAF